MCGIIGYAGKENAAPLILEGLYRLEYRGYDSAGLALWGDSGFAVRKAKGRLAMLEEEVAKNPVSGSLGIGHTRWATHGEPSYLNSHPHLGKEGKIAIVHNGIIENEKQIRARLEEKGIQFASETDSEVIAQLAEYYYKGDIFDTIIRLVNALEGSYALGILCTDVPDTLYAVRKDNPLIVGLAEGGNFIASDVPAVLKHTNQVVYLEDGEIAALRPDGVNFYNTDLEPLNRPAETIEWDVEAAEKGGYHHYMFKEMMEQPAVLRDTLHSFEGEGENKSVLDALNPADFRRIVVTACGSAYNAGVVGKIAFESLCRLPCEVDLASEFRYKDPLCDPSTLVVLVSQSGETADTIAALREAKRRGATTLSVVNVRGSTLAKEADHTLYTLAGPEIAVATTKAFSAQLMVLYALALRFANDVNREALQQIRAELARLPDAVAALLADEHLVQQIAAETYNAKNIFFIGRNVDYAISLEGALKMKELSYVHSEAYAGGELKHGPISLIEDGSLVVGISCCERLRPKILSNLRQVESRGAKVLLVATEGSNIGDSDAALLPVPATHELLSPSLSVIPLQLFAYYVAVNKGLDIDKPRNLAKSVTVE